MRMSPPIVLLLALGAVAVLFYFSQLQLNRKEISYETFRQQLAADNIRELEIDGQQVNGKFKKPPPDPHAEVKKGEKTPLLDKEFTSVLSPLVGEELDRELLDKDIDVIRSKLPPDNLTLMVIVYVGLIILLFGGLWFLMRRARDQITGSGMLGGFNKSPARLYESAKKSETFKDVAGLEGVKKDLGEIVEFLKRPAKFRRLGGRIPKGTLLMGPPGTGKTLLARAVAGEAGVPFFSINGSEFIQMFVGVGASRVRDLFKNAKEAAPCILFIDEIDAVGRVRGAGLGGGHDEREQTLNQILSEMDGFSPSETVIVVAATNRPDVLDPALLRPGRFDRHITVDRPTQIGRIAIFKVHCRNVPLSSDVDLERMAAGTIGLTGADIRNLVNEAALYAAGEGLDVVDMSCFEYARDKVLMGPKREEVLNAKEKRMTAYHESGHALLAWMLPGAERVHKVTVIPRGRALGVTQLLPDEDRMSIGEKDLQTRLAFMLGGRAAEKIVFDEYTAGAENDLMRATDIARRMVTRWGMSERLGPVAYHTMEEHPFLGKEIHQNREFSEHTAQLIDEEVSRILHEAEERAKSLLTEHRDKLDNLANTLEVEETLGDDQIEALIGPSSYTLSADQRRSDAESQARKQDSSNEQSSSEDVGGPEKSGKAQPDVKLATDLEDAVQGNGPTKDSENEGTPTGNATTGDVSSKESTTNGDLSDESAPMDNTSSNVTQRSTPTPSPDRPSGG
jgi:cell division protease FtsH